MILHLGQILKIGKSLFVVAENKPKLEIVILRHVKTGRLLNISYEMIEIIMNEERGD